MVKRHLSKETIEKIRAKAIGRYKGMTWEERYGIERAKEIRKKPIGFKYMKINNPKRFLELQIKRGNIGGLTTQRKHPETRNRIRDWTLNNLDKNTRQLGGIMRHKKYPNLSRETAIRTQKEHPEIGKRLGQSAKENPEIGRLGGITTQRRHPETGKNLGQWAKNHPEYYKKIAIQTHKTHPNLASNMGKSTQRKHPNQSRENAIKAYLTQSKTGFISKPEQTMAKLLPSDFLHNKQLGNVGVPDFHSPTRKIVLQVDGVYWHNIPKVKNRDKAQTAYWQKMGYQIFRITDLDVNKYMKPMLKC